MIRSIVLSILLSAVARAGIDLQLVPIEYSASARNSTSGNYEIMSNGRGMFRRIQFRFLAMLPSAESGIANTRDAPTTLA